VFAGWRTQRKRVPRMVERRVFDGWDFVQQRVPEYEWREVQDGWRVTTVRVPHMVRRRVQVGTEWRWVLERLATPNPPQRPPTPTPTPTRTPTPPDGVPEPTETPVPPGFVIPEPEFPISRAPHPPGHVPVDDEFPDSIRTPLSWGSRGLRTSLALNAARDLRPLQFANLPSGYVGVRVSDAIPSGAKIPFRQGIDYGGFAGTRYCPSTVARITSQNLISRAASNSGLAIPMVTSVGINLYDYTLGENRDVGVASPEFAASTMVDCVVSAGTGLAAAGAVAGLISAAGVIGLTAIATAPLWAAIAATAFIGVGLGLLVDTFVDTDAIKDRVADGIRAWGGIVHNVGTIGRVVIDRAGQAISDFAQNAGEAIGNAAQTATSTLRSVGEGVSQVIHQGTQAIGNAVTNAANAVGSFLGNLFGGG
jgi:hypothetical protein